MLNASLNKNKLNSLIHHVLSTYLLFQIKKIRIGHNGHKPGSGWFLDSVTIDIPSRGLQYMFAAHRWLAKDEEDKQIEIELEPSVKEEREKGKSQGQIREIFGGSFIRHLCDDVQIGVNNQ